MADNNTRGDDDDDDNADINEILHRDNISSELSNDVDEAVAKLFASSS